MPRAHPTAIRHQILGLRSQGLSLVQIASQLLLPYSSVRRLCRRHRDDPARPLNPDYSRCGRRHTAATEALFQAACTLKRNHPTWGLSFTHISLLTEVLTVINLAAIFNNTVHLFELSNELNENTITV